MKLILILIIAFSMGNVFAQKKTNYKYKKYERFDFDALDVEGARSTPGDLSIGQRLKRKYKNKLPERKNFNGEMKRAIDTII